MQNGTKQQHNPLKHKPIIKQIANLSPISFTTFVDVCYNVKYLIQTY